MSQLPLGNWEEIVMLAIRRIGQGGYVPLADVREALQDCLEREIAAGHLYTTVHRLEGKGLLSSFKKKSVRKNGVRQRLDYCLTVQGDQTLHEANRLRLAVQVLEPAPCEAKRGAEDEQDS